MNNIVKLENNNLMINYNKSDDLILDIHGIIETAQKQAYKTIDSILTQRNWLIGYRIAEEELAGHDRADYGTEVLNSYQKSLPKNMVRGMIAAIFIIMSASIRHIQRLSTRRVDFLMSGLLGRIIVCYCRCQMRLQENGTRKRHMNRPGA